MYKKTSFLLFAAIFSVFFTLQHVNAQEQIKIDYKDQPAIDSDLDGLTDQGEIQIYHTDPTKADTDGDGFSDGVEVFGGFDPLDAKSYPGSRVAIDNSPVVTDQASAAPAETPVAWYVSRASGLVAFLLLYISIFLGLTLRIPFLRKIFSPVYSMSIHCWISLQATLFVILHAVSLLFDKWLGFSLAELFVPFASHYQPGMIALGVLGFYFMVILLVTSYGRKFISQKVWRITHFTNIVLYAIVFVHAMYLGTDLKVELFRNIFIWVNAALLFLIFVNIELRIKDSILRKKNLSA